jgi:hypothetical protein
MRILFSASSDRRRNALKSLKKMKEHRQAINGATVHSRDIQRSPPPLKL